MKALYLSMTLALIASAFASTSAHALVQGIPNTIRCESAGTGTQNRIEFRTVSKDGDRQFHADVTLDFEGVRKTFKNREVNFRYEMDGPHFVCFLTQPTGKNYFLFGIDAAQQDSEKRIITDRMFETIRNHELGEPRTQGPIEALGTLVMAQTRSAPGFLDAFVCKFSRR